VKRLLDHDGQAVRVTYWLASDRRIVLLTVFCKTRDRETAEVDRGLSQRADALAATEGAVTLYRRLAESAPTTYSSRLAAALHNLAGHLGMHAKHPPLREAVALYRRLAESDPTTYRPRLAATLHTLAAALDGLGQTHQATSARTEANSLCHEAKTSTPTPKSNNPAKHPGEQSAAPR
jgi:hypothetical protein